MSGAIPFACDAVAAAPDAHQKLHAVALLTTCLQRMKECLEVESCHACNVQLACNPLPGRHAFRRHIGPRPCMVEGSSRVSYRLCRCASVVCGQ